MYINFGAPPEHHNSMLHLPQRAHHPWTTIMVARLEPISITVAMALQIWAVEDPSAKSAGRSNGEISGQIQRSGGRFNEQTGSRRTTPSPAVPIPLPSAGDPKSSWVKSKSIAGGNIYDPSNDHGGPPDQLRHQHPVRSTLPIWPFDDRNSKSMLTISSPAALAPDQGIRHLPWPAPTQAFPHRPILNKEANGHQHAPVEQTSDHGQQGAVQAGWASDHTRHQHGSAHPFDPISPTVHSKVAHLRMQIKPLISNLIWADLLKIDGPSNKNSHLENRASIE
ncbi:hypothetical protein ACLOJK_019417 [Asimina triloba]